MDDDSFLIEPFINQERFLSEANKSFYTYRTLFIDNVEDINNPIGLYNFTYNITKNLIYNIVCSIIYSINIDVTQLAPPKSPNLHDWVGRSIR